MDQPLDVLGLRHVFFEALRTSAWEATILLV